MKFPVRRPCYGWIISLHDRAKVPKKRNQASSFSGPIDLWARWPMSQNALPITVTTRFSFIVSFSVDSMCRGNRVYVQLNTVLRKSHH